MDSGGQGSLGQSSNRSNDTGAETEIPIVRRKCQKSAKAVENEEPGKDGEKLSTEEEDEKRKKEEEERKGIFALGDRMQDRNPMVCLSICHSIHRGFSTSLINLVLGCAICEIPRVTKV